MGIKRFVTSLILLLSLTLSSALTANASSQWMWHGAFPWVYSHAESSWWYMKAGADGKFYAWKQGDEKWYVFDAASKQWFVNGETEAERWARWESNPEPYGGLEALNKIKVAWENNLTVLDIGDYDVSDLTPLTGMSNLTALGVGDNKIADITILGQFTKLTRLVLKDNKQITDFSPLIKLSNLEELDLMYNNLHQLDISPLYQLTNLKVLRVSSYLISSTQLSAIQLALPNCEIKYSEGEEFD